MGELGLTVTLKGVFVGSRRSQEGSKKQGEGPGMSMVGHYNKEKRNDESLASNIFSKIVTGHRCAAVTTHRFVRNYPYLEGAVDMGLLDAGRRRQPTREEGEGSDDLHVCRLM
jgi:hypothetical protein